MTNPGLGVFFSSISLLLAGLALACQRAPGVSFQVGIPEGKPGALVVTLDLRNVPRKELALRAFASKEVMRLSDLEATDEGGAPLRVEAGFEAAAAGSRTVDVPRYVRV